MGKDLLEMLNRKKEKRCRLALGAQETSFRHEVVENNGKMRFRKVYATNNNEHLIQVALMTMKCFHLSLSSHTGSPFY